MINMICCLSQIKKLLVKIHRLVHWTIKPTQQQAEVLKSQLIPEMVKYTPNKYADMYTTKQRLQQQVEN